MKRSAGPTDRGTLAPMARRTGFGLRVQIIAALSAAFVVAFALLGVAMVRLTQRARTLDRSRDHEAVARVVLAGVELEAEGRRDRFDRLAASAIGVAGVRGVEVERGARVVYVRGVSGLGRAVEVEGDGGLMVRVWVQPPGAVSNARVANMLLLYVALTGGAILLLAYVSLTVLIVRPVEAVTRASKRLAGGHLDVDVPVRGAAEVAGLATSFNEMAAQLRRDRVQLEARLREVERATAELEDAQEQVLRSEKLASVGRLSAGVAHEIGNPLAAILGLIELVRGGDLDDGEQDEFLARVQGETERISKIIRDLLDFSRLGESEHEGDCDLAAVLEDAARLIAPRKEHAQVVVEFDVPEDLPRVRGRSGRLTQVALNLFLNAADAMGGKGTIHVEAASNGDGTLTLVVHDSGPGIPEEVLDHLFEPFVTTKPTGQGTGLGLAVSHTIVERLGGTIRAQNAQGGGARFSVTLPLVDPPPEKS